MERKGTAVVTAETVAKGLKGATTTAAEEQTLRMRYGSTVERTETLPQKVQTDSELADELLLIELALLRAMKHRAAQAKAGGTTAKPAPARSAAKSKIVNALKGKKK